jgi:hypothetical protein
MTDEREEGYSQDDVYQYLLTHRIESPWGIDTDKIATNLMIELLKANGGVVMALFLKDDKLREWWNRRVEFAKQKLSEKAEKMRLYNVKLAAYNKLTPAERKLVGIRKPRKPS